MANSIEISVVPSANQIDPQGVIASGSACSIPPVMGRAVVQMEKPKPVGKAEISSSFRGSSPLSVGTSKKIQKLSQTLFEDVVKWVRDKIDENAIDIEIKARPDISAPHKCQITIIYNDQRGGVKYIREKAILPELVSRMEELRQKIRPSQSPPESDPLAAPAPNMLSNTPKEFIERNSSRFEKTLTPEANANLLKNTYTSDTMIQGFTNELHLLIREKEKEPEDPQILPADREKKKRDLAALERLRAELDSVNKDAIREAVVSWNNMATGEIDREKLEALHECGVQVFCSKKGELEEIRAEQLTHTFRMKVPQWMGGITPLDRSKSDDYAHAVEGLLNPEGPPSMAHLIVQRIIHMNDAAGTSSAHLDESYPLLSPFSPEMKAKLIDLSEAVKGKAKEMYNQAQDANDLQGDKFTVLDQRQSALFQAPTP